RQAARDEFDTSLLPGPDKPTSADTLRSAPVPPPLPESRRTTRRRVPTSAIGEVVEEISQRMAQGPVSLGEIMREASRRSESVHAGAVTEKLPPEPEPDIAPLVAAASALRESIEEEWSQDRTEGLEADTPSR